MAGQTCKACGGGGRRIHGLALCTKACETCDGTGVISAVPDRVDSWHRTYARGLITLGELVEELAKLDRRYGPQPFRRAS